MDEVRRAAEEARQPATDLGSIAADLAEVEQQQRRLAQLFTRSDLPEAVLQAESRALAERRSRLEARRRELQPTVPSRAHSYARIVERLPSSLERIRAFVESADENAFALLLRAVDAQITASTERAEVRGVVPIIDQAGDSFVTTARTLA